MTANDNQDDADWELPEGLRAALDADAARDKESEGGDFLDELKSAHEEFVATLVPEEVVTAETDAADGEATDEGQVFYTSPGQEAGEEQERLAYEKAFVDARAKITGVLQSLRPIEANTNQDCKHESGSPGGGEEPVDFDAIAGLARGAMDRVFRAVAAAVPREVFEEFVGRLSDLRVAVGATAADVEAQLEYVVSLVVALAELARADATAVTHLSERLPAPLWLFYTKWMLVVYKITDAFPWFGDATTQSFWLALQTAAPTTVAQTRLLNVLETLVQKALAEPNGTMRIDGEDSKGEQEDDVVATLGLYSLDKLAEMLNFMTASSMPASLRELPRLSLQAARRSMLLSFCGTNSVLRAVILPAQDEDEDALHPLRVKLGVCLYYIEQLELAHKLDAAWGTRVVAEWARDLHSCLGTDADVAKTDAAISAMLATLRQFFQLPCRGSEDFRRALQAVNPVRGPLEASRPERSVENLTLTDVVAHLSRCSSAGKLDTATLAKVNEVGQMVLNARLETGIPCEQAYVRELIALDRAVYTVKGYWLVPVQLVAVICGTIGFGLAVSETEAERHSPALATVLQMETGEGKSVTFAVLAAFFARQGKCVDIATSNEQLARDGAKDAAPLFAALGITCGVASRGEDCDVSVTESYKRQVVYSTMASLAGDYLREVMFPQQHDGRGERAFDVLLADEVDAMLVDNVANMTMLSIPVAGMDKLFFLYGAIDRRVRGMVESGGSMTPADRPDDDLRALVGLPVAARDTDKMPEATSAQPVTTDEAPKSPPDGAVCSTPTKANPQVLPKGFISLCDKKLAVYMDQCWTAHAHLKRGREYDLRKGQIVVIDNRTSGEYQANSVYGDGLHQFLQLKHESALTTESLNSIFISNGAFARKYTSVVGLTGTLGDELDQAAMIRALVRSEDIDTKPFTQDRVRFVFLPRSKLRPFVEFPPLVLNTPALALEYCMSEIQWCRNADRPVLLVCQDKVSAVGLANALTSRADGVALNVKLFIINDPALQTFSVASDRLGPGDIVVSTTYGGRGTDYKLTEAAERNGGLHTVLLFQTASRRQRDQIFGRSARAGVPGSGVLVTHHRFLLAASTDFASRWVEFEADSAAQYHESLAEQLKSNMPLNEGCDQLFQRFIGTYTEAVNSIQRTARPLLRWHLCEAVRNRFGIFMEELKFEIADEYKSTPSAVHGRQPPVVRMLDRYSEWEEQLKQDLTSQDDVITNPRAMVVFAKEIAQNAASNTRGYSWEDVDRVVTRAIDSDAFMAGPPAYFLRLQAMLASKKRNARLQADYEAVKSALKAARDAVAHEIEYYMSVTALVSCNKTSAVVAQLACVVDILMIMDSSTQEALTALEEAFKKHKDADSDRYYLTLSFDHLPDDTDAVVLATYKEMCHTEGHVGMPRLTEERAWTFDWNAFGCLLLGITQVIGGAVLMLVSAGVYGASIVAEGVSDFVASIIAVVKGDGSFSWSEYFENKLVSLAMAAVCAGVCKVGKSLWKAGKALANNGLTLARNGWQRMLQSASRGARAVVERARVAMNGIVRVASTPARTLLSDGLAQCGRKIGRELVKQVVIHTVNVGVDASIKAAFDALHESIHDKVKVSVNAWTERHDAVLAKFCRLRGPTAYRALVASSAAKVLAPESKVQTLLSTFGDALTDTIADQLKDHSEKTGSKRHALLATAVKVLVEGAKWVDVIAKVVTFVDAWLGGVDKVCACELEHIRCIEIKNTLSLTDKQLDVLSQLGVKIHEAGSARHLECTRVLTTSESHVKVLKANLNLLSAVTSAGQAYEAEQAYDKAVASGEDTSWEPQRSLMREALTKVATDFIRDKLEVRSAATSRKISSYGIGKLVDKISQGRVDRKAQQLNDYEPHDEADAGRHMQSVERFVQDTEIQEAVDSQLFAAMDGRNATIAHATALAELNNVCIVIHEDARGQLVVLNPAATNGHVHLDISDSRVVDGTVVQHLRPRGDVLGEYADAPDGSDSLYRAIHFATRESNATAGEIAHIRARVDAHILKSPQLQVFLYANRKPRRIFGSLDNNAAPRARRGRVSAVQPTPTVVEIEMVSTKQDHSVRASSLEVE